MGMDCRSRPLYAPQYLNVLFVCYGGLAAKRTSVVVAKQGVDRNSLLKPSFRLTTSISHYG